MFSFPTSNALHYESPDPRARDCSLLVRCAYDEEPVGGAEADADLGACSTLRLVEGKRDDVGTMVPEHESGPGKGDLSNPDGTCETVHLCDAVDPVQVSFVEAHAERIGVRERRSFLVLRHDRRVSDCRTFCYTA
jgi:hypothetical protein